MTEPPARRTVAVVAVADLLWAAAALAFVLLRLGPVWQAPVGGAELDALSGAWNAHLGVDDARWTPTLFQALVSFSFSFGESEVPARTLAFLATASIPAAIYCLRGFLTVPGALIALSLLSFDATGINLGTTATPMGLDLAIAAWLFAAYVNRWPLPAWVWGAIGFVVATAGPLALPLVIAFAGLALFRREGPPRIAVVAAGAGAIAGTAAASFGFGRGGEGLVLPPVDVLSAAFEQAWSSATTGELALLYSLPIVAGGLAALGLGVYELIRSENGRDPSAMVLLAWTGIAGLWLLAASGSHSPAPVAAFTLPAALLLGPALVRAAEAMVRADWRFARYFLPVAALSAAVATNICFAWADRQDIGNGAEQGIVVLLYGVAVIALAAVCIERRAIPALFSALLAAGAIPVVAGAFGVALSAQEELVPSPVSTDQARELRAIALETVADRGGLIVVHPDLRDAITWPFRDSGDIHLSSQVPEGATIIIWPPDAGVPDGFVPVEGQWSLTNAVEAPVSDWLDLLQWVGDRNELQISSPQVAVYTVASE